MQQIEQQAFGALCQNSLPLEIPVKMSEIQIVLAALFESVSVTPQLLPALTKTSSNYNEKSLRVIYF